MFVMSVCAIRMVNVGKNEARKKKEPKHACYWIEREVRSLGADVHVPHSVVKRVRMVAMSRKERMVMISLMRLFCCPWWHTVGRSLRRIRRSCTSWCNWALRQSTNSRWSHVSWWKLWSVWRRPRVLCGMEKAPWSRTFQYRSDSGGLRNSQTSAQLFGIDPGHHNGVGTGGVGKAQSAKASSMVLMLFLLRHRHAVPLNSPATRSICWPINMAIHRFWASILLICRDRTVKVFWPLRGRLRQEARESTP